MMRTHPAETADTHAHTHTETHTRAHAHTEASPCDRHTSFSLALIHTLLKGDSFIAATFALIHCGNAGSGLPGIPLTNLSRLHREGLSLSVSFRGSGNPLL